MIESRTSLRAIGIVIDAAPRWLWKPSNLRFIAAHTLHFCYRHEGRRTVEWNGREIAVGRRQRVPPDYV